MSSTSAKLDTALFFNGIDGSSGNLLFPNTTLDAFGTELRGAMPDRGWQKLFEPIKRLFKRADRTFLFGPQATEIQKVGWAVVVPENLSAAVANSVQSLITERRRLLGGSLCKELVYPKNMELESWLNTMGVGLGTNDETDYHKVPYYLLIIGGPEDIPFELQIALGTSRAVGRLAFEHADQYGNYSEGVLRFEKDGLPDCVASSQVWAPKNQNDRATELSHTYLARPLAQPQDPSQPKLFGESFLADQATKSKLINLITHPLGNQRTRIVFTASHGLGFPIDHPSQKDTQGALAGQIWPAHGDYAMRAADITDAADLAGLLMFCFGCYTAGTPEFQHLPVRSGTPTRVSRQPFVSRLSQALLGHPNRPALAFIGHVDRAWGCSFVPRNGHEQLYPFRDAISAVLSGRPVGLAIKSFHEMSATLAERLCREIEKPPAARSLSPADLARLSVRHNDAQNYILLGDPSIALCKRR